MICAWKRFCAGERAFSRRGAAGSGASTRASTVLVVVSGVGKAAEVGVGSLFIARRNSSVGNWVEVYFHCSHILVEGVNSRHQEDGCGGGESMRVNIEDPVESR